MKSKGFEVTRFSEWDGLPIKNKLPEELKIRLKTKKQWLDEGYLVNPDATAYEMHHQVLAKMTYIYYHEDDVTKITPEDNIQTCATCRYRQKQYCIVMAAFTGAEERCSEWSS